MKEASQLLGLRLKDKRLLADLTSFSWFLYSKKDFILYFSEVKKTLEYVMLCGLFIIHIIQFKSIRRHQVIGQQEGSKFQIDRIYAIDILEFRLIFEFERSFSNTTFELFS